MPGIHYECLCRRNANAVPFVLSYDPAVQFEGPLIKDKIFLFSSAERILFNRANPATVSGLPPASTNSNAPKFAQVLQVLPGREGQAGLRIEF